MLPLLASTATKLLLPSGSKFKSTQTKKVDSKKLLGSSEAKSGSEIVKISKKSISIAPSAPKINLSKFIGDVESVEDKSTEDATVENLKKKGNYISEILDNLIKYFKSKRKKAKKESENRRKESEKERKEERESQLEEKKVRRKGGGLLPSAPRMSFMDRIMNFFTSILIGSLLKFLLKNSATIFKIFDDIASGINNIWDVIRIGIISLTTVFRKQIRLLLKLGKFITKGPAKLAGKLLKKLGVSLKNLLVAVGKFVTNKIKQVAGLITGAPTTRGSGAPKRVDPSKAKGKPTARKPIKPAKPGTPKPTSKPTIDRAKNLFGNKGVKRLAKVSKVFKRIPFVGALIGIGIDMAMGERLDNAIAGAAGASLGSAIGAGVGSLIFPGLGTLAGGFIGGVVGDWAGKEIYKLLKAKVFGIEPPEEELDAPSTPSSTPGTGARGGQVTTVQGMVSGGNADFWTLAAIASLESGNPQGQADVAQSIYNRAAAGIFPGGKNIKNIITASGQYSPVGESDPSKWAAIVDEATAIAAVASHKNGGVNAARMVSNAAQNINNPSLQKNAASWVGGRTDFTVPSKMNVHQYRSANLSKEISRHGHVFGWFVGPGSASYGQSNPGPVGVPNLGGASTPTPPSSGQVTSTQMGTKTGLVTGYGGGDPFHIDTRWARDLPMDVVVPMIDSMAAVLAADGRVMEMGHAGSVSGKRYPLNGTRVQKEAFLRAATAGHHKQRSMAAFDYFIPKSNETQWGNSAKYANIPAPALPPGYKISFHQGRAADGGAFYQITDPSGRVVFKTLHGDPSKSKLGLVGQSRPSTLASRTARSVQQQASYDQQGGTVVVPISTPSSQGPMIGSGGLMPLPIGMSKKALLNSYYQTQLTGFLYKQG